MEYGQFGVFLDGKKTYISSLFCVPFCVWCLDWKGGSGIEIEEVETARVFGRTIGEDQHLAGRSGFDCRAGVNAVSGGKAEAVCEKAAERWFPGFCWLV